MRWLLTSMLVLMGLSGQAQDWAPYVPGQEYYFEVYDSVVQEDFIFKDIFQTKLKRQNHTVYYRHDGYGHCAADEVQGEPAGWSGLHTDSLVFRNDRLTYYGLGDSFIFYHHAPPGTTWRIPAFDYFNLSFDTIEIAVHQIYHDTVLGLTDSCKRFTLQAISGGDSVSHPINQNSIVISKNYGLLRDAGIFHALQPNADIHYFHTIWPYYQGRIIGLQSDTVSTGFHLPPIDSFFNYQPGTILVWEERIIYEFPPQPDDVFIHRDSIVSVNYQPPILSYIYHRQKQKVGSSGVVYEGPQQGQIDLNKFQFLRDGPSEYISADTVTTGSTEALIWYNRTISGTATSYCIEAVSHGYEMSESCELGAITDARRIRTICNRVGWVKEHLYNFGDRNFTLIGYNDSNYSFGNTGPLGIAINSGGTAGSLLVHPNPATSHFTLELPEAVLLKGTLIIQDATGRTLLTKALNGQRTWNITHLRPGVYVVSVAADYHSYRTKLIIQ